VREIADVVRTLVRPVPVHHVPARPADYQGVSISNRLAKELLGWSPVTSLESGVRRYIGWLAEGGAGHNGCRHD
jgi:UDP-glucose 4-epimerase